jgi:Cu(I)/Ag(I) efflux system membrane fusion protein
MEKINKSTIILVIVTLSFGLLLGWVLFGGSSIEPEITEANIAETQTVWTCSMHPQIRSNEVGDCPLCGMDLIPLVEGNTGGVDQMAISMSAVALKLAEVTTSKVSKTTASKTIRVNGKVTVDESSIFTQSSHVAGRVEGLALNFTGEFVKKGQAIASIYSPELVTAQEELLEALKVEDTQPDLVQAAKKKLANWMLTEAQITQIIASKNIVDVVTIEADVSGYVSKKLVNQGDYVQKGSAIYEITNLYNVWVEFDIYESDISLIKKGSPISYTIQAIPAKVFTANISYVDPVINPLTRIAKARVEVKNQELLLKPEMFARGIVTISIGDERNSIVIPKSAVMWTGERSVVYVMQKTSNETSFTMREVVLGQDLGDSYIISSGLKENEIIATNGTFSIDAAAQLAGKSSMMSPTDDRMGMTQDSEKLANTSVLAIDTKIKKVLEKLFDQYFAMSMALSKDGYDQAKIAGLNMGKVLAEIDNRLFDKDAKTVWLAYSKALGNEIEKVEKLDDIESLRAEYLNISKSMIAIIETFKPIDAAVYLQHCPMANSDKGADWLALDEQINNPYFGSSMLRCGEVTKIIQ